MEVIISTWGAKGEEDRAEKGDQDRMSQIEYSGKNIRHFANAKRGQEALCWLVSTEWQKA